MKHCGICLINEILARSSEAKTKKMRRALEQSVCSITRNKILKPLQTRLSLFCNEEHFALAKNLRYFYDANGKTGIERQELQIRSCLVAIEKNQEWLAEAIIVGNIQRADVCLLFIQKLTQKLRQHTRWLKHYQNRPDINRISAFDIFELLSGNKPNVPRLSEKKEKQIVEMLTESAKAFKSSNRPSILEELTKHAKDLTQEQALLHIEEHNPFGDLDSGDPS